MAAALGAGRVGRSRAAVAQAPSPDIAVAPYRVDTHHHFFPPFYLAEARQQILAAAQGFPQLFEWTPEKAIAELDKNAVATAIVSISTPGIWFGDVAASRKLARRCNEYAAQLAKDHPGRFGFFAAIPLPDPEGSLAEIDYALGTLKADGIGLLSNYGDKWLGDPAYAAAFDELNRRKTVVFVHPAVANCCTTLLPGVQSGLVELLFDSTRTITSLLFSGTLARCSDLQFIFCHGGGALGQMAERISALDYQKALAPRFPNGVMHQLKKLHLDVTNMTSPAGFDAVRDLVGIPNMLLGSDFPYGPLAATINGLARLKLPPEELRAIERDNALRLLPQLRT
ncbi:MAG: amidohydrolase [Rhodospirillales bacterium]|nr:amidohydrolase [Rhodospirillales bacterium]